MAFKNVVASILERETESTIASWYNRVEMEGDLIPIPLSHGERCAHLPKVFRDLITRLRNPLPLGTRALMSDEAHEYGCLRRGQGYTPAMMVEESRMLQVAIFQALQKNLKNPRAMALLLDIMSIADELDSQLAQAITSYMAGSNRDVELIGD